MKKGTVLLLLLAIILFVNACSSSKEETDALRDAVSSREDTSGKPVSEKESTEKQFTPENGSREKAGENISAVVSSELPAAGTSVKVDIPFELQKESSTWPIACLCHKYNYDYDDSGFLLGFSSVKEVRECLTEALRSEEPMEDSAEKIYWDLTIQPMLDAIYAKFDDAFFAENELLLFRVCTISTSFAPDKYSLTKRGSRLVLEYGLDSSGVPLPDGTMIITAGLGLYPVLLAVKRADLEGIERYSVVFRAE